MQIVTIHFPLDVQGRYIEPRPQRIAPVPVDPRAIDANSEGWSKKTEKCPIEPVIGNIAAADRTFKTCEVWHDGLVGHGGIVKRKRAGKEPIARNSRGVGGVTSSDHCG